MRITHLNTDFRMPDCAAELVLIFPRSRGRVCCGAHFGTICSRLSYSSQSSLHNSATREHAHTPSRCRPAGTAPLPVTRPEISGFGITSSTVPGAGSEPAVVMASNFQGLLAFEAPDGRSAAKHDSPGTASPPRSAEHCHRAARAPDADHPADPVTQQRMLAEAAAAFAAMSFGDDEAGAWQTDTRHAWGQPPGAWSSEEEEAEEEEAGGREGADADRLGEELHGFSALTGGPTSAPYHTRLADHRARIAASRRFGIAPDLLFRPAGGSGGAATDSAPSALPTPPRQKAGEHMGGGTSPAFRMELGGALGLPAASAAGAEPSGAADAAGADRRPAWWRQDSSGGAAESNGHASLPGGAAPQAAVPATSLPAMQEAIRARATHREGAVLSAASRVRADAEAAWSSSLRAEAAAVAGASGEPSTKDEATVKEERIARRMRRQARAAVRGADTAGSDDSSSDHDSPGAGRAVHGTAGDVDDGSHPSPPAHPPSEAISPPALPALVGRGGVPLIDVMVDSTLMFGRQHVWVDNVPAPYARPGQAGHPLAGAAEAEAASTSGSAGASSSEVDAATGAAADAPATSWAGVPPAESVPECPDAVAAATALLDAMDREKDRGRGSMDVDAFGSAGGITTPAVSGLPEGLGASLEGAGGDTTGDVADYGVTAGGLVFDADAQSAITVTPREVTATRNSAEAAAAPDPIHPPAASLAALAQLLDASSSAGKGRSREAVQLWTAAAEAGIGGGTAFGREPAAGGLRGADVASAVAELRRLMGP